MDDPFSRQHVLVLLGHVILQIVEHDVFVAGEDDALGGAEGAILLVSNDSGDIWVTIQSKKLWHA